MELIEWEHLICLYKAHCYYSGTSAVLSRILYLFISCVIINSVMTVARNVSLTLSGQTLINFTA